MNSFNSNLQMHPNAIPISPLPQCRGFGSRKCVTLRFSPPSAHPLIEIILQDNKLKSNDFAEYNTEDELRTFIFNNPNTTLVGLAFDKDFQSSNIVHYNVFYNDSSAPSLSSKIEYAVNVLPAVQVSVDNAITKYRLQQLLNGISDKLPVTISNALMNIKLKNIPIPILSDTATVFIQGIFYYAICGFLLQFTFAVLWVVFLYNIVTEKALNLRFAMTVMGMRNSSWWHSWFIYGIFKVIVAVLLVYIIGLALRMKIFLWVNPFVIFIVFSTYGFSCILIAMFLSVITTTTRQALLIAFVINGICFFSGLFTTNGLLIYVFYKFAPSIAYSLSALPPFQFGKCISDFITITSGMDNLNPGHGRYYTWNMFFKPLRTLFAEAPATYLSVLFMWATNLVLIILTWYLDNILSTSMNGKTKPFYFFLLPSYWGFATNSSSMQHISKKLIAARHRALNLVKDEPDSRVAEHIMSAVEQIENEPESNVFRLIQLEKSYRRLFKSPVKAVQNVSIKANKGMCLALLGHNGAGKSTIISAIIGQIGIDAGECFVFGMDIKSDLSKIRRETGICMQNDFLNSKMTAWEHLQLFAAFKNLKGKNEKITEQLKAVGLYEVRHKLVSTFSGGMKRRLSCALALLGSPSMVILDEPTTGLDINSKRLIWKLIQIMKKDKLVLLTTHSMEEAEKLGDVIAIMAYGKLKCIGNSLQLKTQFGTGFNLYITCNVIAPKEVDNISETFMQMMREQSISKANVVKDLIKKYVPHAEEVSHEANALLYKLPNLSMKDLIPLVKDVEAISITKQGEEGAIVKSFHLSQSSLEEVYLNVMKRANFHVSGTRNT